MSETFLSRLENIAYAPRQEGRRPEERLVRTSDLRLLLEHFRRLDNAARQQYEEPWLIDTEHVQRDIAALLNEKEG